MGEMYEMEGYLANARPGSWEVGGEVTTTMTTFVKSAANAN